MWYVLSMNGATTTDEAALAGILAEREKYRGFLLAAEQELADTGVFYEQVNLRKEIVRIREALTRLAVKEHELLGKIKRPVAAREVKCPTCGRYLPAGEILSDGLKKALAAAMK